MSPLATVANNYMNTSSCTTYEDRRDARRGIHRVTPLKRRADSLDNEPDVPIMLARTGGNKLRFYYKVLPMIKKAYSKGKKEVDVATASMLEFSTYLRNSRRNPRQHVAAYGVPDLSDIIDDEEPESPTVVRQPVLKAESRSPAKRIARLTNPFSKTPRGNRLAQGFVKLVPGLARGGFSTPMKSRASPVPQTASPVYDYAVASLQYSPNASDDDLPSPTKEASPEPAEGTPSPTRSPGRTFRVPSEFDSSSIAGDESTRGPPSTPNKSSPVNFSRPIAPTPSRWIRAEPATPFTPMPQSAAPATPSQSDSPIGLYALLAPDTPKAPVCTYKTPNGIESIDFGGVSPFQSSLSWMNTSVQASESKRSQNVVQGRRRQSEPLLRKLIETQARRRSASPQKLRFKSDDTFHDVISIASLFDLPASAENTTLESVAEDDTISEMAPVESADEAIVADPAATEEVTMNDDTHADVTTDDITAPVESVDETIVDDPTPTTAAEEVTMVEATHADVTFDNVTAPVESNEEAHMDKSTPSENSAVSEIAPVQVIEETNVSDDTPAQEVTMEDPAPIETTDEVEVADVAPVNTTEEIDMADAIPIEEEAMTDIAPVESTDETNVADTTPMEITITPAVETTPAQKSAAPNVEMSIDNQTTTAHDDSQPAAEQSIVQIDMRENPDIFGAHPSSPPAPIKNLSRMADDACNGLAKVVVTEENGRLFVRFKLSAEYAHMFPASQGFEDNDLTFSPSAMPSTPRIKANSNRLMSQAQPNLSSPPKMDQTPVATASRDFSFSSPFTASTPANMATPASRSIDDLLKTPDVTGLGITKDASSPAFQTPELPAYHDNTLDFAEAPSTVRPASTKRATRRQSAMTPLKRATANAMEASKLATPAKAAEPNYSTPKFATPMASDADQTLAISWPDVEDTPVQSNKQNSEIAPAEDEPIISTPVDTVTAAPVQDELPSTPAIDNDTVAPVQDEPASSASVIDAITNAPAEDEHVTTPSINTTVTAPAQDEPTVSTNLIPASTAPAQDEPVTHSAPAIQDYDSPGREYMRNFIKHTRQPTATESGSPIPPATKRQPLTDRSPNKGSPLKTKRKHEDGTEVDEQSPPKKAKVEAKRKTARQKANLDIDMVDLPMTQATESTTTTTPADAADDKAASPPTTRRSSRLRSLDTSGAPKSSLPTPIKLTRAGAGRGLTKKPRTEEQELDRKTRSNTKKNMGDAESPAEVLTRLKGQAEEDSDVSEGSAGGRRVGWNNPLEKVEGSSPKKGRAAPKGKATQGQTGVSKPKSTKTTRAAKVAEGLGMVANGTPAKSQRVTRSRARNGA